MHTLFLLLATVCAIAAPARGAGLERIRVDVLFRESGTTSGDVLGGSGGVIVTERGLSRGSLGLEADSRTTRTKRSSGVFTIVQDGGASRIAMATRVPIREVAWWHDYALGVGHAVETVTFENVGTSLRVRASVLADGKIRVALVPSVSWFAADGSGAIDFTEAATELVVAPGEEVMIGGGTRELHEVTRRILGIASTSGSGESSVVLRATIE